MPGTGEILSITVAADGKWSVTASTDIASGTVSVTASNAAGVVSAAKTLTLQIDASIATPVISLISDSGSSATDKVTSNSAFSVSADSDSLLAYSTNGTTWATTFTPAEGANTVQVRATDAAGNVATSSAFSFTLDSQTSAFTVALSCDSGTASDKLSRDATLVITGAEAGASIEYSTNGSTWTSTYTAAEGLNNLKVRVMDAAGNQRTQDYSFTLDSTAPTPAVLTLVCDSGSQGADKLSNNGNINIAAEAGATLEYSTNGTTWGSTFAASEGANTVSVRVTDQAGNVSSTSSLSFTLDSAAPTAPTVGLVCDSGSSTGAGTDKLSNIGTLSLSSVEAGGQLEYSTNGVNWATTFAAAEGTNNVQVRVTDAAGNLGAVTNYSFTLDTQAPVAPVLGLVCDSGALGTDKITSDGRYTVTTLEVGATLQYSTDGVGWGTTFTAAEGSNTVKARVIDAAGNAGAASTLSFTLDTVISKPTVALACDSGTSNSDGITRSGALNLNHIDSDAQVQYSTDGQTWTSSFTAVEGTNSVTLKVTDAAGNVATSDTLSFTLNAADAVFTAQLDLSSNSGSQTDLLTQDLTPTISGTGTEGDIIQVTMPGTGEILSTTVAADGKWSVTASTDVASGTVSVTASNAAGVVSAAKTLTLQIDASITTPVISLISDSGSSATDKVTSNGTFAVSADSDSLLEYSTNGTTWATTFAAAEGANTVQVRATDAAGNVATSAAFSFTLDSQTSAFTVALSCDSGTASDKLSRDATLVITGAEAGASVEYSTNGTTWTSTYTAAEGLNNVKVRVMDAAGNQRTQDYSFTLDSTAPTPAVLTLVCDSGSQLGDKLTNNGNINVAAEVGATLEYSTNGTTWGSTFAASEGANTVSVRVTDQAGNVSATSSLSFTLDSAAPTAPTVGLVCDSGSSTGAGTDKLSNIGTLSLSSVEAGGQLEYSTNGVNWATTFAAAEGSNNVQVRVTDAAGNLGAVTNYSFTLDTQAPDAPVLVLVCDTGALGTDKITSDGRYSVTTLEVGATLQYSTDGVGWGTTFTAAEGSNTVKARVIDAAGNAGAASTLSFTLDTVISKPTVALACDSGTSNSDGITRNGALNLNNVDSDAQVQYSTDGQTWTSSFTAVEGTNSVTLKVTDAAGNVATSDTLSFTLNAAGAVFTAQLDLSSNSGSPTDLLTQDLTPTISGTGTEGDIIQVTMPGTGEILSTTVAADGKWSVTASTDVASGTVSVTASNAAGVVSAAKTLTLQIDASIATPVISLISDSGSSATDKVTSNSAFSVSADSDSQLEYSTNGSTWTSTYAALEGANTVQVRATDAAGNVATSSAFSFTLDSQTSAFTVSLSCDSGTTGDKLSRDATLVITGAEAGADINYSTNGTTWTSTYTAAEGLNTVKVRVMDAAGNQRTQDYSFTLDSTAPTPAVLTLVCDSGSQGADKLTNNGNINVVAEAGATLEYSTNGTTWGTTFTAAEGANTVSVRVTDQAGNVSEASSLSFTLDSAAPTAPTVGLVCDSGSSTGAGTDKLSNIGTLSLSSVEAGGQLEYSTNGVNWATTFAAAEGVNNVKVRVTDATGNTGAVATYSFTLDTQAPDAPVLGLVCDSGALGTDKITQTGNLTASSLEAGATLQYSTNGTAWGSTFAAGEGSNTVYARVVDAAGNTGAASQLVFTVDTFIVKPILTLACDTGTPGDLVTIDASLNVPGSATGSAIEA
eukprot:gene53676-biopygen26142